MPWIDSYHQRQPVLGQVREREVWSQVEKHESTQHAHIHAHTHAHTHTYTQTHTRGDAHKKEEHRLKRQKWRKREAGKGLSGLRRGKAVERSRRRQVKKHCWFTAFDYLYTSAHDTSSQVHTFNEWSHRLMMHLSGNVPDGRYRLQRRHKCEGEE